MAMFLFCIRCYQSNIIINCGLSRRAPNQCSQCLWEMGRTRNNRNMGSVRCESSSVALLRWLQCSRCSRPGTGLLNYLLVGEFITCFSVALVTTCKTASSAQETTDEARPNRQSMCNHIWVRYESTLGWYKACSNGHTWDDA